MGGFFKTPFFLRIPCGHRVRFSPVRFRFLKYGRSRKLNVSARMGRSASLQPRPISLSWITGVHKVLYYVSNFYAKNSSLHQPCSHGHWVRFAHTACPSDFALLEVGNGFYMVRMAKHIRRLYIFCFKSVFMQIF